MKWDEKDEALIESLATKLTGGRHLVPASAVAIAARAAMQLERLSHDLADCGPEEEPRPTMAEARAAHLARMAQQLSAPEREEVDVDGQD